MAKFSMNCEGSSTKSHHTLVPDRLSKRELAKMPCSEWPNSCRKVSTSPSVSRAGLSAVGFVRFITTLTWGLTFTPFLSIHCPWNSVIHAPPCFPLRGWKSA